METPVTIESHTDIARGLRFLEEAEPRFAALAAETGPLPLRRSAPGFAGLARIVIAQQVSKQSADAITARFEATLPDCDAHAFLEAGADALTGVGLSRPKLRTLTAVAEAVRTGTLDLDALCALPPGDAIAAMTKVHGIGPWTAEVYLLFCAGHRDILPSGDLALRIAAMEAFGLEERPSAAELARLGESWSPWRGVAARLLWAWYGHRRQRAVMP